MVANIHLLTIPGLLGYVFNPVSFWLCLDTQNRLIAVVAEVNNTFGGRHCYSCFKADFSPIAYDDTLEQRKVLHVSPFCKVEGHYRFKFCLQAEKIRISIDYFDNSGEIILLTTLNARKKTLNDKNLLFFLMAYPLMTMKVIGLIHYHALRLWLKKVPFFGKNPYNS
jgi:DUF1365 family protein